MSWSSARLAGSATGLAFRAVMGACVLALLGVTSVRAASAAEETPVPASNPEATPPAVAPPPVPVPPNTTPPADPKPKSDCVVELPPYRFPYKNGLYATIAGFTAIKDVDARNVRQMKLNVDGFRKSVPVRAIIQNHPAPLVVILMGIDGKADGKLGKLWPSWYDNIGCHVLTFDSTFLPQFILMSGHGVTGNVFAESERVALIISAFLRQGDMKSNVTQIGVVGMSYGGLQAMALGQMGKEGKLSFQIDTIQAYSPPIRLQHTGELIDQWYTEDRWNFTLVELADKLTGHKPVSADSPIPFDDSLMRAGLAAIFHLGIADVVLKNDSEFHLHALPSGDQFDDQYVKQDYAETWGYAKFMNDMCYPYWQRKLNLHDASELTDLTDVCNLVKRNPQSSEVILAEDDPFNMPSDLADLKACSPTARITFLPTGGHLGFVSDPWTKAKLMALFKCIPGTEAKAVAPATTPAPAPAPTQNAPVAPTETPKQ